MAGRNKLMQQSQMLPTMLACTPVAKQNVISYNDYYFRLYGPVEGPEFYTEWIDILDQCSEDDTIHFFINTPGGDLDGAISLIHAIQRCRGNVITYADGDVASAGTIILFAGHEIVVLPYAHFMAHDASSNSYGKVSENRKSNEAVSALIEKIYRDLYTPYITKTEIDSILSGIDLYLSAEQLQERIDRAKNHMTVEDLAKSDPGQ